MRVAPFAASVLTLLAFGCQVQLPGARPGIAASNRPSTRASPRNLPATLPGVAASVKQAQLNVLQEKLKREQAAESQLAQQFNQAQAQLPDTLSLDEIQEEIQTQQEALAQLAALREQQRQEALARYTEQVNARVQEAASSRADAEALRSAIIASQTRIRALEQQISLNALYNRSDAVDSLQASLATEQSRLAGLNDQLRATEIRAGVAGTVGNEAERIALKHADEAAEHQYEIDRKAAETKLEQLNTRYQQTQKAIADGRARIDSLRMQLEEQRFRVATLRQQLEDARGAG